jgi:hypothetical protein
VELVYIDDTWRDAALSSANPAQGAVHYLLLLKNGIDRMSSGKRHVAAHLNDEQRALLAQVPSLSPTMASIIEGRVAYGRLFLPRARRFMERHGQTYPEAFEAATVQHLWETLGLSL